MKHEQEEILVDLDILPASNEHPLQLNVGSLVKWKHRLRADTTSDDLYLVLGFDKEAPNIAFVCSTNVHSRVRRFHISQLELIT